jgi:hypothetical protein
MVLPLRGAQTAVTDTEALNTSAISALSIVLNLDFWDYGIGLMAALRFPYRLPLARQSRKSFLHVNHGSDKKLDTNPLSVFLTPFREGNPSQST